MFSFYTFAFARYCILYMSSKRSIFCWKISLVSFVKLFFLYVISKISIFYCWIFDNYQKPSSRTMWFIIKPVKLMGRLWKHCFCFGKKFNWEKFYFGAVWVKTNRRKTKGSWAASFYHLGSWNERKVEKKESNKWDHGYSVSYQRSSKSKINECVVLLRSL